MSQLLLVVQPVPRLAARAITVQTKSVNCAVQLTLTKTNNTPSIPYVFFSLIVQSWDKHEYIEAKCVQYDYIDEHTTKCVQYDYIDEHTTKCVQYDYIDEHTAKCVQYDYIDEHTAKCVQYKYIDELKLLNAKCVRIQYVGHTSYCSRIAGKPRQSFNSVHADL